MRLSSEPWTLNRVASPIMPVLPPASTYKISLAGLGKALNGMVVCGLLTAVTVEMVKEAFEISKKVLFELSVILMKHLVDAGPITAH